MRIKLLVIIVTYNGLQWIERCLKSIYKSTFIPDVIIIDNGSIDGTQDFITKNFQKVILKQSETNLGFGKANNIGIEYAIKNDYTYVYLLNQDAWVLPDTFDKLIMLQNKNPEFGILSPIQVEANLKKIDSNFAHYVCSWNSNHDFLSDCYMDALHDIYEVPQVMAAHWLISCLCYKQVGLFSPSFPHYGEDDNYAQRVRYHGFKIGIVPSAIGVHDRENRVPSKRKNIYIEYIRHIDSLSNPFERAEFQILHIISRSISQSIKLRSFYPIELLTKTLCHYSQIKKNRNETLAKGAFLNNI